MGREAGSARARRRQRSDHVSVTATTPTVRLAEVIALLSLATGLAGSVPLEHGLRRTLVAACLGQELQLPEEQMRDVYYVAQLGTVGCSVEGTLLATVSPRRADCPGRQCHSRPDQQRWATQSSYAVRLSVN